MRTDLTKPHFNDKGSSDQYLTDPGLNLADPSWQPPQKGYFRIDCGSAYPLEHELVEEVRGVDVVSGLPRKAVVTSEEVREALA